MGKYVYECKEYRVEEKDYDADSGETLYKVTVLTAPAQFYLNHKPHRYVIKGETFWTYGYPDVHIVA